MSVLDAHLLATKIENTLRTAYPELSDVVIHTGPSANASSTRPELAPGTSRRCRRPSG